MLGNGMLGSSVAEDAVLDSSGRVTYNIGLL